MSTTEDTLVPLEKKFKTHTKTHKPFIYVIYKLINHLIM